MSAHQAIKAADWVAGSSDFFSAAQLEPYGALLVTIESTSMGDVPREGTKQTDKRHTVRFKGWSKPVVVSARCNRIFLQQVLGGTSTREWPGKQIWVYYDPTAQYGGETRGGIRFAWGDRYSGQVERRRKNQPVPPPPPKPTPIPSGPPRASSPTIDPARDDPPPPEAYDPDTGEVGPAELREPGQEG